MSNFRLGTRSEQNLVGVHPHLQRVVRRAITITPVDFIVTEGLRSLNRQRALVAAGASKTYNSRHITGHAIDVAALVGSQVRWDWPLYRRIADAMKQAAEAQGIPIVWGGDWRTFRDGPHFELPRKFYPA